MKIVIAFIFCLSIFCNSVETNDEQNSQIENNQNESLIEKNVINVDEINDNFSGEPMDENSNQSKHISEEFVYIDNHLLKYVENNIRFKNLENDFKALSRKIIEMETSENTKYESLNQIINDTKNQLHNLQYNSVPIGFIYVQLPDQPEPKILWPTLEWEDITSNYAGLFFRAEGGKSAKFGQIQDEDTIKINNVERLEPGVVPDKIKISSGECSGKVIILNDYAQEQSRPITFYASNGEVRPKNMAFRIWKRINK